MKANAQEKKVFAHYMLGVGSYDNNSVEGFKREIKEAIAYGIDGFALDFGSWEPRFQENMKNMVQAIDETDSDFVFFFSFDKAANMSDDLPVQLIKQYYDNKHYFRYKGAFFVSAWDPMGSAENWDENVLGPLKRQGLNLYFVPYFAPNKKETPSYSDYDDNDRDWRGHMDGYFHFGPAGVPLNTRKYPSVIVTGEAAAKAAHGNNLTYMAEVSPLFYQTKQLARRAPRLFDYPGGEGLIAQWESILQVQKPDWVELVTWNDWDEATYFSPMQDVATHSSHARHHEPGFYKSHVGYAALNRYFIEWYKTGTQPEPKKDELFYFYRTHPENAKASSDELGESLEKAGDIKDEIYVTTILTAPADLEVSTGGKTHTYHLNRGLQNTQIPFQPGEQFFVLSRDGKDVVKAQGENIESSIDLYNFNYYSGFAE